jgi:hypothetical protein
MPDLETGWLPAGHSEAAFDPAGGASVDDGLINKYAGVIMPAMAMATMFGIFLVR